MDGDDLFFESESRRALRQAVKYLRLPGQPESQRLLEDSQREFRPARRRPRSGQKEISPAAQSRHPVTDEEMVRARDDGERLNQFPRIDRHPRRLRVHNVGRINRYRGHRNTNEGACAKPAATGRDSGRSTYNFKPERVNWQLCYA